MEAEELLEGYVKKIHEMWQLKDKLKFLKCGIKGDFKTIRDIVGLYLFSWDNVPGNDSEGILRFLRDDIDICWAENAEIRKSDDGKTICIFKDENSAEIMIDEKEKKATIKISEGWTNDLKVKKENGKLNIYVFKPPKWDEKKAFIGICDNRIERLKTSATELVTIIGAVIAGLALFLIKYSEIPLFLILSILLLISALIFAFYYYRAQMYAWYAVKEGVLLVK